MNKKVIVAVFILAILVLFCAAASANNGLAFIPEAKDTNAFSSAEHTMINNEYKASVLPTSLSIIEESAFEGTALTTIELPDKVEAVYDYAFANIKNLRQINVPYSTTYIAINTFKGSNLVTIKAAPNSYARVWAKENGVPFAPVATYCAVNNTAQVTGLSAGGTESREILPEDGIADNEHVKPTGRMAGELNASRYEGCNAFHVQGRAPPMV